MRAILNASGYQKEMDPILYYHPTPLLKIGDKPILFYIIEFLVQNGIQEIDLILNHLPNLIEECLQEGKRWGVAINYHLVKSALQPFSTIHYFAQKKWIGEKLILGKGDSLPYFSLKNFQEGSSPVLMVYPDNRWTGWAILSPEQLCQIPPNKEEGDLLSSLPFEYSKVKVRPFLSTCSFEEWKRSNYRFSRMKSFPEHFPLTAKHFQNGVFISRGVSLHPTTQIFPPVFIGANCQIEENVTLGPYAILERNCLIDKESHVEHSLICSRSYVGERLDISNCIIDRNLLINLSLLTTLTIHDDFVLSELPTISFKKIFLNWIERFAALLLILISAPILAWLFLTNKLVKTPIIKIPASYDKLEWTTFDWLSFQPVKKTEREYPKLFIYLPVLFNILRGEAHFVGLSPRTKDEIEALPPDWKKLYLNSKIGLITLTDIEYEKSPSLDECYATEAFYTIHMGFRFDGKILWQWMKIKIKKLSQNLLKKR